jgi:hypothetical protein
MAGASEPRINRFTFEGRDAKDTFVKAAERFLANEAFQ